MFLKVVEVHQKKWSTSADKRKCISCKTHARERNEGNAFCIEIQLCSTLSANLRFKGEGINLPHCQTFDIAFSQQSLWTRGKRFIVRACFFLISDILIHDLFTKLPKQQSNPLLDAGILKKHIINMAGSRQVLRLTQKPHSQGQDGWGN